MRQTTPLLTAVVLALCACGDDGESIDSKPGAQMNGAKCLFSNAGANVCRGGICLGIAEESAFGVCSEPCSVGVECKYGGVCALIDSPALDARHCLVECTAPGSSCPDSPPVACFPWAAIHPCDNGGCQQDDSRSWCQPPLPEL